MPDSSLRPHPFPLSSELRVFISSTFRDLQEEREHLIKKVFPEIRALCRERGVTFTEVDLRWGVTAEEAEQGGVVRSVWRRSSAAARSSSAFSANATAGCPILRSFELDPALRNDFPWIDQAVCGGGEHDCVGDRSWRAEYSRDARLRLLLLPRPRGDAGYSSWRRCRHPGESAAAEGENPYLRCNAAGRF